MEAHRPYCQGSTFLGYLPRPPQPRYCPCPWRPSHTKPLSHSRISFSSNNFPRWDSTDPFRPSNFSFNNARTKPLEEEDDDDDEDDDGYGKKRRWWSDESAEETEEGYSGTWEDALDSLWILKIFKSYGWTLPVIVASWLLSTGPKAFLMALAIPLGQSALTLAFEKLWGRTESKPKRKYKTKRKRRNVNDTRFDEEPDEENQKTSTRKAGVQSWVVENDGSVDSGSRNAPSFGGWDDLERPRSTRRKSQTKKGSQRMTMEGGSWTKML
ncbi:uncharacterized protein LOC131595826 isoform X2 [Vicia villosa]|uniref:uncharacterized protein LOC131595826 isoform X2 n=1 Tax=Vicia villosa TaxID=3911 RepID=UPI00273C314B|nr:uncharacterized protein LOC131595826 isoform X2 [Vicia villosa]XP_058724297.1 uncharacterized protein LOC131595826 isoform X2 [Vicia villosa]XP_058724298.1 uncharacterized protein LOC131595826 isoform X2 [Vicia villosa]